MRVPLLIALLLMTMPMAAHAAATDPFGFADEEYSYWGIVGVPYPFEPERDTGRPDGYGCFPVGNGYAFGHLGVSGDFTALSGLMGPGYQSRSAAGKAEYWSPGVWPDLRPVVMRQGDAGELLPLPAWSSQSIEQLRGAAMVRTIQRSHVIDLFVLTYALPDRPVIVQEFALYANPEMQPVLSLELPGLKQNEQHQPYLEHGNDRLTVLAFGLQGLASAPPAGAFTMPKFSAGATAVEVHFGHDADTPGLFRAALCYKFTGPDWQQPQPRREPVVFAEMTADWWRDWSAGNLAFDTGDALLDDMLAQLPVIIETQRDGYSGGVAPMVSYHGYWVRDSLGPILCDLDNGRFNEVMDMLRYHRAACLHYGHCHMMVPLDLDLSDLDGWLPGQPGSVGCLSYIGTERGDWQDVGVEHAEVPSLIVLQHFLLWRAMHEAGEGGVADAFISEAWQFLTHNLLGMDYDPGRGVRFHGDETYAGGALYSTYDREASGAIGYPNGYIPTEFYSYDNTMLHRCAAGAWLDMAVAVLDMDSGFPWVAQSQQQAMVVLEDMTRILGTQYLNIFGQGAMAISPASQERWLAPYANIALRPGWLGLDYGPPLETNYWQAAKDGLWQRPYPLTTPWSGYFTGHSLGYWLSAAARNGDEYFAEEALDMLLSAATPEGAWCEVLDEDATPVEIYGRVNRIRPWESGVNYHAIVETLSHEGPWLYFDPANQGWEPEPVTRGNRAAPYPFTEVLAITREPGCLERVRADHRFAEVAPERVRCWDAGMPFSIADLRETLLGENIILLDEQVNPGDGLLIPYFYFDEGVRGGLDRRTFKDEEFWSGEEMAELLAEYESKGGTVLTSESLEYKLADGEVVALRMLVVLCTDTFTHQMTQAEVENFHHEVAQWIDWYDGVAGDRLRLELDYLQIDQHLTPRMSGPQGSEVYWMGYEDAGQLLRDRGIADGAYDSVAFFWGWSRGFTWPDGTPAKQAYGGAAQGPSDDMAFLGQAGKTSYFGSAVRTERPGGPSKTALHEYLHNIDAMFEYVGDSRIFHPDHMSRNMETLLSEAPGGFEQWGYTDDEVREMVAAELRNEIHFPWPTQLVYYEQALTRIPREDYAALLKNFGRRAPREPRAYVYEHFILPEGVEPYQVYFHSRDGLEHVVVEEYDFVDKDHRLSAHDLWCGNPQPPGSQLACLCPELEIACPDVMTHVIGEDAGVIEVNLAGHGPAENYADVKVWADLNGDRFELAPGGNGNYSFALPGGLGESNDLVFHVDAGIYACTPVPVELIVRPAWELGLDWANMGSDTNGIRLMLSGPEGEYMLTADVRSRFNTIQQLLCADGLLREIDIHAEIGAVPGYDSQFSTGAGPVEIKACPAQVLVERTGTDGSVSSHLHEFPQTLNASRLLFGVPEDKLPDYVIRSYPVLDGEPDRRLFIPQINLTHESGNVFTGTIDSYDDAMVQLGIGYSAEGLIIAGFIRDDMMPANGTWDSDRLNLVFDAELNTTEDTYPDGAVGHTAWERDDYWVILLPCQQDGPQTMRLGGEKPGGGVGYYGSVEGAQATVTESEGARSIRWEIPWSELPFLDYPEPGTLIGFTVFYSDYDESLAEMMYLTDWGTEEGIEWRFWDTGLLYFAE